jgi:hypothetical protein
MPGKNIKGIACIWRSKQNNSLIKPTIQSVGSNLRRNEVRLEEDSKEGRRLIFNYLV